MHRNGFNCVLRSTKLRIYAALSGAMRLSVILLLGHPAFLTHNFVSVMQSFYFSESLDAMVLQTCHEE